MLATSHRTRPARRGTVILEFVIILPLLIFLTFFAVDLGRLILLKGALADATYLAARSGAQYGDAYQDGNAEKTFNGSIAVGGSPEDFTFEVVRSRCTANNAYIETHATQNVDLITPGLGALLGALDDDPSFTLDAKAIALCQVVR